MKNQKILYILALLGSIFLIANSGSHPTSGTKGYTGAPISGEGICAQCHTSNNTALDGTINITGLPTIVEADQTYTIEVQLTNPNGAAVRGGFQLLAIDGTTQAGSWSNASSGSIIKIPNGGPNQYLGHQGTQTFPGSNVLSWTGDWTAPSGPDNESIDFYVVGIIGNGGNGNQNDRFQQTQVNVTLNAGTPPLSITVEEISDPLCHDSEDGSAQVIITGGSPGYDIEWDNGESTEIATMLSNGFHSVTVTDNDGSTSEGSIELNAPLELSAFIINTSNVSCEENNDGTTNVGANGGTAPYTFSKDGVNITSSNNVEFTNLASGTYVIQITDSNGCTDNLICTIFQDPEIDLTITATNPLCAQSSTGSASVDINQGTPPYEIEWSNGENTSAIENLIEGEYSITVTDDNGCSSSNSIIITDPTEVNIDNVIINQPTCQGLNDGSINIISTGGTAPYFYNWSDGSNTNPNSGLPAGSYTLTVTDNNGCSISETYNLTNTTSIEITTETTSESIPGAQDGTATVAVVSGGEPPYNYLWSNGEATETISNLSSGTYQLTVTDSNGCSITEEAIVLSEDCSLTIGVNISNISCFGSSDGSISLDITNAVEPYTYNWSNGSQESSINNLVAGTYSVTVTDNEDCSNIVESIEINEPAMINANIEIIESLACGGVTQGILTVNVIGAASPVSYLWSTSETEDTISVMALGTYMVTATDANGCVSTDSVTLTATDEQPPVLQLQNVLRYIDENGNIEALEPQDFDNGSLDNCSSVSLGYNELPLVGCDQLGSQIIEIIGTDESNNSDTMEVTLTIRDTFPPVLTICQADTIIDNCSPFIYDLPTALDNCGSELSFEVIGVLSGTELPEDSTVSISVIVSDASDNSSTCTFTARQIPDINTIITTMDLNCHDSNDGSVEIEVMGTHEPFLIDSALINNMLEAGTYSVQIEDTTGCQEVFDFDILSPEEIFVSGNVTDATTNLTNDGQVEIIVSNGQAPYVYDLIDDNGNIIDSNNSGQFIMLSPNDYSVAITDSNGCMATIDITIGIVTSTEDLFDSAGIVFYPNPAADMIYIDIESISVIQCIEVLNSNGQSIYHLQSKANNNIEINTSDWSAGLYFLKVSSSDLNSSKKVSIIK